MKKYILILAFLLYLPNTRMTVVQQPADHPEWVSPWESVVTQLYQASNLWLVAHDYRAGRYFKSLKIGDVLYVDEQEFIVTDILYYETQDFEIFQRNGKRQTNLELWQELSAYPLILQTCTDTGVMFIAGSPTALSDSGRGHVSFVSPPHP